MGQLSFPPMNHGFAELRAGLSKRTMREQIADRIAGMIASGLVRPGDELPSERDLSATLDVSRETVRGAIQTLAALGMIEVAQGARSRVLEPAGWLGSPPSAAAGRLERYTPEEVYGARKVVEMAVAQEAARRLDAAGLDRLRKLVEAQAGMLDDPVAFQISDIEFHAAIYRAGGNRLLAGFLSEVYDYALHLRRRALLVPGAVRRSWQDHRRILATLEARDGEAAAAAMARHLLRVHRTTLLAMRSKPHNAAG